MRLMEIYSIEVGPVLTMSYVVYDKLTKDAIIIDVPLQSHRLLYDFIKQKGLKVHGILLTHSHWDHTADVPELMKLLNVPIYIHQSDEYRLLEPKKYSVFELSFKLLPFPADKYLKDAEELSFGSLQFSILHTPGHTEGSICIYFKNDKTVFSGDTLFNMSVGRTDLLGGNWDTLYNSIKNKLLVLPDTTDVYCGHGESTTIGLERQYNPFLIENTLL